MENSKKSSKQKLAESVRASLFPQLEQLGFVKVTGVSFARGYTFIRDRDGAEEKIEFWWANYNRPRFVIQFTTSQKERLDSIRGSRPTSALLDHARGYPARRSLFRTALGTEPAWFQIGGIASVLYPERARHNVIAVAKVRLDEIDLFLKTGRSSRHFFL